MISPVFAVPFAALAILALAGAAVAADAPKLPPKFTVLPWNGAQAAVSLTFDDGDPSHLDTAIPALDAHHLKGTFFLIAGKITDLPRWQAAEKEGHEIGNHSMTHDHPEAFTAEQVADQTTGAQQKLAGEFQGPILAFAYPYTAITPAMKDSIARTHMAARGGWGQSYYLKPTDNPDLMNIPSQVTMTASPLSTYTGWVDADVDAGAWTVFMIHGLEGTTWGYQPISKAVFNGLLDRLQDPKIWVAPFGAVAAYWQAEKVVEQAAPAWDGRQWEIKWTSPATFPRGVVLKLRVDDDRRVHVTQSGKAVKPDKDGVYAIAFDTGEMAIR